MDVRCERCNAQYAVDDALVHDAGLAVRCSRCGHLFRVMKSRGWSLRKKTGDVYPLPDSATLQRWIVEGRVTRDDEISRDGEPWVKAGSMTELDTFFAVVDQARRAKPAPDPAASQSEPRGTPLPGNRLEPVRDEPAGEPTGTRSPQRRGNTGAWDVAGPAPVEADEPAWATGHGAVAGPVQGERVPSATTARPATREPVPRGRRWPWILGLFLLVIAAGAASGAAVYFFRPEWIPPDVLSFVRSWTGEEPRPPVATPSPPAAPQPSPEPPARTAPPTQPPVTAPTPTPTPAPAPAPAPAAAARNEHEQAAAPPAPSAPPEGATVPGTPQARPPAPPERSAAANGGAAPGPEEGKAPPPAPAPETPPAVKGAPAETPPPAPRAAPPPAPAEKHLAQAPPAAPARKEKPAPTARRDAPRRVQDLIDDARRLRDRGRADAALDMYGRALQVNGSNADALAGRGLCYLDLSRYTPAEDSFKSALAVNPAHAVALMGLAETYRYEGKRADAVTYYRKYLSAHPTGEDAGAARNAIKALEE